MANFLIGSREFEPPVFVPSVSSYETQIPPDKGLLVQDAISEPISLASAFDLLVTSDLPAAVRRFRWNQGVLLLDSGGYESGRYNRFSTTDRSADWSLAEFVKRARTTEYDLAFSFDVFPTEGQTPSEYADRLAVLLSEHDGIQNERLIPVVHLVTESGNVAFNYKKSPEVVERVAEMGGSEFIAVPERELGDSVVERAGHARKLVRSLDRSHCRLHALGCGNPLSVALLGISGVAMMDGLEWCRTVMAPENSHLHHFRQLEIFEEDLNPYDPTAAMMFAAINDYTLRTAIHNLVFFRGFMAKLRDTMRNGKVEEFLVAQYGIGVRRALEAIEDA